jgi:hypothetical protein
MKRKKKSTKKQRTRKVTYPFVEQTFKGRQSENPIPYKAEKQKKK